MQGLSEHFQKQFFLYADLILVQKKAYQTLEIHKQALSNEEYSFYKRDIPPPHSLGEDSIHTKSASLFQSLVFMQSNIQESLREQTTSTQSKSHLIIYLWQEMTRDYESNVFANTKKYITVVGEVAFCCSTSSFFFRQ